MTKKELERIIWLNNCLEQENVLKEKIANNLKESWIFSRLPPLEKAILIYATYELFFGSTTFSKEMIIDQVVNFSKAYLEKDKHKYINKNLDLSWKSLSEF